MTMYKRPNATESTGVRMREREKEERKTKPKKDDFLSVARHYVFTLHFDFPVRKWSHAYNASETCDVTSSLLTFYTVRVCCLL